MNNQTSDQETIIHHEKSVIQISKYASVVERQKESSVVQEQQANCSVWHTRFFSIYNRRNKHNQSSVW